MTTLKKHHVEQTKTAPQAKSFLPFLCPKCNQIHAIFMDEKDNVITKFTFSIEDMTKMAELDLQAMLRDAQDMLSDKPEKLHS